MKGWGKDIGDSLTVGFELVLPTILFALLGYYIDKHFATFPLVLIIGIFLGAAAGFWNVVRKFLTSPEEKEKR